MTSTEYPGANAGDRQKQFIVERCAMYAGMKRSLEAIALVAGLGATPMLGMEIKSAQGSIYFIQEDGIKQGYDLTIRNPGGPLEARLNVVWNHGRFSAPLETIPSGESVKRVYIPDIRVPVKMRFAIQGREGASITIDHAPRRHWTVHIIQYSHHDLGYTGIPSRVLKEMASFYDDALRFCKETDLFPDDSKFRYTIEQGWSLLYFLQNRPPAVCEEMVRRLKEGRLEVNAFTGNETTELLGPEQMVRMLYPVFALKRQYGVPVATAELNDIPGISWGVAAALSGAGIRYFAPGLPEWYFLGSKVHLFWDDKILMPGNRPHAFYWQGPDGEKTLFWAHHQGASGPSDVSLGDLPAYLQELEKTDYPYSVLRYIDRGGARDNANIRVEYAYTCREWNSRYAFPRFRLSRNADFFADLQEQAKNIPTWRGEIPGTDYPVGANSEAYASSLNRLNHDQLLAAERFATIASEISTYAYPREDLDEAYFCTLMNDEHCTGFSEIVGPAHEASIIQHNEFAFRAAALAHDVLVKSVNEIADQVKRDEDGTYLVVFNPLNWARTDVATFAAKPLKPASGVMKLESVSEDGSSRPPRFRNAMVSNRRIVNLTSDMVEKGFRMLDMTTGQSVPHERHEIDDPHAPMPYAPARYSLGRYDRLKTIDFLFLAENVPPLGYKTYKLVPGENPSVADEIKVESAGMENRFYKIRLHPETGAIASIYDKELNRELIDAGAAYGANQIVIRSSMDGSISTSRQARIRPGKRGPVSASLVVETQALGYPQITQEIIVYRDVKRIDIANRVLKDVMSQLETFFAFPFAFDRPSFKYEGSLSIIEPLVDQLPGTNSRYHTVQHWADVSDGENGATFCSLDAPMVQFGDNWPLYVSRAHHGVTPPNYGQPFHGREALKKGHLYSLVLLNNYRTNFSPTQNGDFLFRYSIASHRGNWLDGRPRNMGYGISLPFATALVENKSKGTLPPSQSWCSVDKENILLLALKRAEDGNGLIVRVMETEGRDTDFTVRLPFVDGKTAYATNLVEENQNLLSLSKSGTTAHAKAWGTSTIRLIP